MNTLALLATGGTIASADSADGLRPALSALELTRMTPGLDSIAAVRARDVFSLDSSNIQPEEWRQIAEHAHDMLRECDAAVITHGTDTMAYTAAALSFMLRREGKAIVLTGSQLPAGGALSDAPANLLGAARAATQAPPGVYVYFNHKLIDGTRAVKMRTTSFDAFDSVNAPLRGYLDADGLHIRDAHPNALPYGAPETELEPRVFLLRLMPGTSPDVFRYVAQTGYRGLVLEAFGLGGLHYIRRNLVDALAELSAQGVYTLVTTQCMYEKADFTVYEVGKHVLSSRVIGARDMTTEAAVAKLMWVLGRPEERLSTLSQSIAGEMSER